jgi:hypothetical protein
MGNAKAGPVRLLFNPQLRVEFHGATGTSDARLRPRVIAYNLGNLLRRLALPLTIGSWPLPSLQQRLFKIAGRLIRHARYFTLQLAESHLTGGLFQHTLGRIERLALHTT